MSMIAPVKKKKKKTQLQNDPIFFFFRSSQTNNQKGKERTDIAPPNFAILITITIKIVIKGEFLQQNKSHYVGRSFSVIKLRVVRDV